MYVGPWTQPLGTPLWLKGWYKGMAGTHIGKGIECARCAKPISRGEPMFILTKTFMDKGIVPRGRIAYHWSCFVDTCRSASPLWDSELATFIGSAPAHQRSLPMGDTHVHNR